MARNLDDPFFFLHGPNASEAKRVETANIRAGRRCSIAPPSAASHANN
jgi:hypothetical protein